MIESHIAKVYLSQIVQILLATTKIVSLSKTHKIFEDIFLWEKSGHFLLHKNYEHVIDFIDNKQSSYRQIYILSKNKLSIVWAYIDKYLANKFIRLSKSFFYTCIHFMPKLNKSLRLCVDYWNLNNLIINNWYLFLLVNNSFNWFSQVKQFTKLDFTDTYY